VHHLAMPPDTGLHNLLEYVWNQVDFDFFVELHLWNFDGVVGQGNSSVAIDDSGLTQAKDIFGRCVRLGQGERAEKAIALFLGFVEADAGNLFGRGMDLVVVVAVHFLLENGTNLFHG
jgi:hypothetical protein